jgi:hypothetical protein
MIIITQVKVGGEFKIQSSKFELKVRNQCKIVKGNF